MQRLFHNASLVFDRIRARSIVRDVNQAGSKSIISRSRTVTRAAEKLRNESNIPQDAAALREIEIARQNLERLSAAGPRAIQAAAQEIVQTRNTLIRAAGDYLNDTRVVLAHSIYFDQDRHDYADLTLQMHFREYKVPSTAAVFQRLAVQ